MISTITMKNNICLRTMILLFFLLLELSQFNFFVNASPVQVLKNNQKISNHAMEQKPFSKSNTKNDHNIDINPLIRLPTLTPNATEHLKIGEHGAISSDLLVCNELVYNEVLLKHGKTKVNAADMSVTLGLCVGLVNFFNSGVGGGGFAIHTSRHPEREEDTGTYFDFRETCPLSWDNEKYNLSTLGGLSIGLPGELKGYYEIYTTLGSGHVSWKDLLMPVVKLAYEGWEVSEVLEAALQVYKIPFEENFDDWSFVFSDVSQKTLKKAGEHITRPNFGKMLEVLAKNGSCAPFYDPDHWINKSMLKKIKEKGGIINQADFANYHVRIGKPLTTKIHIDEYWPLTVYTTGGVTSGAALLSALNIMEKFPKRKGGDYTSESAYELVEAMKWMASARSRLGDYNEEKELELRMQEILSDEWAINSSALIKNANLKTQKDWRDYKPQYQLTEPHGTTHFSIIDYNSNAISLTSTINLLFGSLVHDPVTGVIFNNEMDDFSNPKDDDHSNSFGLKPSIYNYPMPGKRPVSSASPVIVLDELNYPDLVIGASGGSRITTSVLQSLIRIYWYHMPLLETISYPRFHHQLLPNTLEVENGSMIGTRTIKELKEMGHDIQEVPPKSVLNGIKRDRKFLNYHAVSDWWRKRGMSLGY